MPFEFLDQIGKGGFGVVRLARRRTDGTLVVVKQLLESADLRRFQREVQIQTELPHPNLTPILEMDLEADPPWFSMPPAKENLKVRLDRNYGDDMLWAFYDLAAGVQHLHDNGVVHRDVTPMNALVFEVPESECARKERVCVADLGLGKLMPNDSSTLTSTASAFGTWRYAAPEQFEEGGFRDAGVSADVYALGRVLYKLLSGEDPPMLAPLNLNLVPPKFQPIIKRATAMDPAQRHASVEVLVQAIRQATEPPVVVSPTAPLPPGQTRNLRRFLGHLREKMYHPRSDKHSNALAWTIVNDLIDHCAQIREEAASGALVVDLNFTIRAATSEWKADLVFGPPPFGISGPVPPNEFLNVPPATVRIAIEIKSVMTEHRKAIKNRKRDFEAHHEHVHRYDPNAIAGGVLMLNASEVFKSPLRDDVTIHRAPEALVAHCLDQFRAVAVRSGSSDVGLDAKCALVVRFSNLGPQDSPELVTKPPAPQVGDPMHYDAFIQTLCSQYGRRFPRAGRTLVGPPRHG